MVIICGVMLFLSEHYSFFVANMQLNLLIYGDNICSSWEGVMPSSKYFGKGYHFCRLFQGLIKMYILTVELASLAWFVVRWPTKLKFTSLISSLWCQQRWEGSIADTHHAPLGMVNCRCCVSRYQNYPESSSMVSLYSFNCSVLLPQLIKLSILTVKNARLS